MPAPELGRFRVLVVGSGATCDEVRRSLVEAGFPQVAHLARPGDTGEGLRVAIAGAELVVHCAGEGGAFARLDRVCARAHVPCLHVEDQRDRIVVGPLFAPGRTVCFACSRAVMSRFEGGGREPGETVARWMSALAGEVAADQARAFVARGAHLRVASCAAISGYEGARPRRNLVETWFTPAMMPCAICGAPERDARPAPPQAAFIVGSQRSGTTMLGLALDAHDRSEVLDEDRAYMALAQQPSPGSRMPIYKVPVWTAAVGFFARHFPGGAYLFMRRPTVQVVASMLSLRGFTGASWAELFAETETRVAIAGFSDPEITHVLERHLARAGENPALLGTICAVAKQALASEYRARGLRVLEVDYEQLVARPRPALAGVLDFLGMPWSDRVLDRRAGGATIGQTDRGRAIDADSVDKYTRVLDPETIGAIQRFEESLLADLARARPVTA